MNTASDKVIELIKNRLSEDTEFISVISAGLKVSSVTVFKNGNTLKVPMDKVSTLDHINDRIIEVTVNEGDTVDSAIAKLSEDYAMYFLSGVDYPSDTSPIVFNGADTITYRVTLNEACVSMYGSIEIVFRNQATCLRCQGVQKPELNKIKLRLALACKLFTTYDVIVVGGSGIGRGLALNIASHVNQVIGIEVIEPGLLQAAEVVDLFNDGVSDIAIIQFPNNDQHFIRYRFIQSGPLVVPEEPTMTL